MHCTALHCIHTYDMLYHLHYAIYVHATRHLVAVVVDDEYCAIHISALWINRARLLRPQYLDKE